MSTIICSSKVFTTWISGLNSIQGAVNRIKSFDTSFHTVSKGFYDTSVLQKYADELSGLTKRQALVALSTKNLTDTQVDQVLSQMGLIALEDRIQAELLETTLAQQGLSTAKQVAILNSLDMINMDTMEVISTKTCTKAELENALATQGVTGANAEAVLSALGFTTANTGLSFSFDVLTASISASLKALKSFLLTTPAGWATLAIGAIASMALELNHLSKLEKKTSDDALETYNKTKEVIQENKEESQSLSNLIEKYKELKENASMDATSKNEIKEIQYEIASLVGAEAKNLDLVNGKLDEQIEKLKAIQANKSAQDAADARDNYYKASTASDNIAGNFDKYGNDASISQLELYSAYGYTPQLPKHGFYDSYTDTNGNHGNWKDLKKRFTEEYGDIVRESKNPLSHDLVIDTTNIDNISEKITRLKELKDFIGNEGLNKSNLYLDVADSIKYYEEQYESEMEAGTYLIESLMSSYSKSNDTLSKININSISSFEDYRKKMYLEIQKDDDVSEMMDSKLISNENLVNILDTYLATSEEFSGWYEKWKTGISDSTKNSYISFKQAFQADNFKESKNTLLDLATAGELSAETLNSTEKYKSLIEQTGLSAEILIQKIKGFNIIEKTKDISNLKVLLSDIQSGKTLTLPQISGLISDNTSLASSIEKIGTAYKIEESALESLINSKTEQYNISIAKQTEETKNTIKETKKRITAYQAEINAIQQKNNVNLRNADKNGHATENGYHGSTLTTNEQDAQNYILLKSKQKNDTNLINDLDNELETLELDNFSNKHLNTSNSSSQMNFIELLLNRVSKATEKIKKSFEDAFSLIGAKQNLTKALSQIQKEIQTNSSAYAKYMAKANKVGLDKTYVLQIQNGSLNIKDFDSDNDSESEIYDKIQSYQQWYEKAQACKDTIDNLRESEQSLKESYVDKIKEYYDRKTKTYQNKIDATNDFVSMNEDIYGYASSSLYNTAMKNTSKSISVYRKELSTLQKEQKLVNKSTNPTLWYKYLDAIDEAKSSVNDLADSYLSLAKSKAEAAITKRDAKVEKLNNTKSLNDSKINNKIGYSKKNSIISNNIYTEKEILSQYKTAKEEGTKAFKNEKKESSTKAFQKTLAKSGISKALIEKANHAVKQGTKIPAKVLNALKKNLSGNKNAENAYKQFLEYNTALNIKDTSASDYAKQNQESKSNIKQYQQQLLDQISEDFDLRIKAIQDKQSLLESQWDKMEAAGTEKTEQYYKKSIQNSKQENALLQKEQKALYKQLTSNKWNKNSKEYKDAKSRLNDINVQIQNNTKTQIEWNNAMLNMPIDKLSKALGLMEAISNANKSIMDYYKTVRGYSTESDFKNQISDNSKQIEIQKGLYELYTERAAKAAISGSWLGKSYEEWMQEAQNAKGSIFDFQTENENLKDSLHDEVYLKPFEDMIEYSQRALDKIKDMESLFSTFDFTLYDEKGNLNEYGLAQMKTTFHQLSKTKTVLSSIVDEMKKLDELYADPDSGMNAIEHQEKKIELVDKYNSTLLESANIMKTITDMMKEQTKQQIDSIKKQIEAYKNLFSTQKEENSYQKSIKDKTDTISSLQKRLLALGNSSTEETQTEYQKVLNELETANDDLEETEWEHYIDMQIQALDDLSESLDDYLNNIDITLESILETLNNAKGIVADVDSSQLLNKLLELVGGDKNIFSGSNTSTPPKQSITKTDLQNWVNNEITRTKKEFNSKTAGGKLGSHLNASEYQHVQQLSKYFTSLESLLDSKDYDGLLKIYNNSNGTEYYMSNPNAVDTKNASIIEDIAEFIKKIGGINDMGGYFSNTIDTLNQFIHSYDKTERENHLKAITNGLNNTLNLMRYHGENEKANKLESYLIPYLKNIGINLPGFSQGGIVEQVARNSDDGIVSLKATEAFLSENEIAFLKKIDLIHPIIPSLIDDLSHLNYSLASTDSAQSNSIENVNINLECPAVTKEELYSWLQDTRTQKIIQSSVIDPIMGNGTFGRYQH